MKAMNKCQGCGKSISGGYLCEECEAAALETHKGKRYVLSGITGIVLLTAAYIAWTKYKEKQSEIDLTGVYRLPDMAVAIGKSIIGSPYIFVPLVLILLIVAFFVGTKLSK